MKLSEAFKKIKPAKCIRVTAKGITEIDIVSPSYSVITELFLQDNRISSINNISQFSNLTRLALENNAISNVEELEDIRNLPNLREIRLKGNPICNIPLFHQQVANFFEDYIIIDSKKVHFTKNKAKYENNIIFSIFISDFFSKIQKKPKIELLINQLNNFLKKNDYISFAHKLRYSFLKCEAKTYFIQLKQLCSQKIHNDCEKCSSFESLSNFIAKIYYSKLSYLSENDIKKFNFPFFNNSSNESKDGSSLSQTANAFFPYTDVNNFYSCCCFNKKKRKVIPQIKAATKSKIKNIEADEDSTIAFDIDIEMTEVKNSVFHQENKKLPNFNEDNNINDITVNNNLLQNVKNQNSESSVRKIVHKNDSKNWLSMPAIESDFSTFSFQRAVVFSEPFNTKEKNDKKSVKQLSIEESAEFSLISTTEPHEHQIPENEHIELLNTSSSSSSSNSKSRKSSMKLALSTSSTSSSSFAIINSPHNSLMIPSTNKQKFPNSPRNKVKVLNSNNRVNLSQKLSTSSSSFGNLEAEKTEENNGQAHTSDENNNYNNNSLANNKNNQKKESSRLGVASSLVYNDFNMISEANVPKSENSFENEVDTPINENSQTKKRKKVRRKKKTFPDDSISEVFED